MMLRIEDNSKERMQMMIKTVQFSKLLHGLEGCREDEQKQKIEKMNEIIDGMNNEEFESVFKADPFKKIEKTIEEKKMSMEIAILLPNHVGYYEIMKCVGWYSFFFSSLNAKLERMIFDEYEKKEEKTEKNLVDLCECYLLLNNGSSSELLSIVVPCLLKVALKKEENEKVQKEVEMALLALSSMGVRRIAEQELYFQEIKEIIQYHQEHRNLTRLAYQSAWKFLMDQFYKDENLRIVVENELHFVREAAREIEDLSKCVNWKRKGDKKVKETKEAKEAKEMIIIRRWQEMLYVYFDECQSRNGECSELFGSLVQVHRAARDNYAEISRECRDPLKEAAKRIAHVEDLLKGEAIDAVLDEKD
eukprot:MONOS_14618.1-p1 / transcript=MONOS_14618.1 / gene=MONOS_14618 / organism=Monocercomonoides_exilis_PA203 / gene_product=unspecified product / transcript_product=unspecified product / location=Mono_scaffold01036:2959-4406(-) / protein_length=362 / sequence_SO=supercontig / SO=protein_coding / is_pseudo=false